MSDIAKILLPFGDRTNDPKLITLHAMGEYIHADKNAVDYYATHGKFLELGRDYHAPEWLRALGLSAHQLICPGGMRIKCREDNHGAWHARGFNEDSLGVEFLVRGIHTYDTFLAAIALPWVDNDQFSEGQELVRYWMETHDIRKFGVKYHSELSPGRKKDPGAGFPSSFRETL